MFSTVENNREALYVEIIVVSDSVSNGEKLDSSGETLKNLFENNRSKFFYKNFSITKRVVSDNLEKIKATLIASCNNGNDSSVGLIITVGGTGFYKRDVTPEATKAVIEKECNSLSTLMLTKGIQSTPFAALSRGISGIRKNCLIINFPGSQKAVEDCFYSLIPILPHAIDLLSGKSSHSDFKTTKKENLEKNCYCGSNSQTESHPSDGIEYQDALNIILKEPENINKEIEVIDINDSIGRQCAKTIRSKNAVPEFPKSIMDGYALVAPISKSSVLDVTDKISSISNGSAQFCCKISTGKTVPSVLNAVVPIEHTKLVNNDKQIIIFEDVKVGQCIRQFGDDIHFNEIIIQKGERITESYYTLLKSLGYQKIEVFEQIKISILATGNEVSFKKKHKVINMGQKKNSEQVYDVNSPLLELEISTKKLGLTSNCGIMVDDFDKLTNKISEMIDNSDIIITSGGTSVGEKDYIEPALKKLNCHIHFNRVKIKPGKPTIFATCFRNGANKYIFCLPGNPVSCWVTFQLFVRPFICTILNTPLPPMIKVKVSNDIKISDSRQEFLRGRLVSSSENIQSVEILPGEQYSSRFLSICGCHVLIIIPSTLKKRDIVEKGTILDGILI